MSWPVYTKRLGAFSAETSGLVTLGTVPAGKVWIVRDVDATLTGGSIGQMETIVAGVAVFSVFIATSEGETFPWRGRQPLTAGETLEAYITSGTWDLLAAGYELNAA